MFFALEIVSLIVFGIILPFILTGTWEDEQKQKLYNYTLNMSQIYQEYTNSGNPDTHSMILHAVANTADMSKSDIFITDKNGKLLFCSDMSDENNLICEKHGNIQIPGEITTGILAGGKMATIGSLGGIYENEHFIAASVSRKAFSYEADVIVFAVQTMNDGLEQYYTNFIEIYLTAALGFIAITGLVVYGLTYTLVRIIRDMAEAAKRYAKGDFSYRIKVQDRSSVREFDELSAEINSMAENLDSLENSRAEFVANVSHELKTPMTTIGGFIDGILDGTIEKENHKHYLQIVSDEVKRLSRLIVSMLNMSKMEADELKINPSKFNLTQQIVGIFIAFEQKINDKQINITGLELLPNAYIEADPDMINQVFYNLVDNAVKFAQQGGEISVSIKIQETDVIVKIRNTGKLIAEEDIEHVFERFYKGDKSRSLDAKSAGLGLFIVKSLVLLHDGDVSVCNINNKYTQFTVKLNTEFTKE